ncbi:hypothetical protein AVEN_251009-1 [Araneus ventricosus]|uniref:Uncharacterized protein n=1 Tax=Araneus ventricosus TaxID=182803 RepID=A0A4Y2FGT5_ARAVE|nr:hypothetical protein AVEN_251009-1 [Araneus ventricosus]
MMKTPPDLPSPNLYTTPAEGRLTLDGFPDVHQGRIHNGSSVESGLESATLHEVTAAPNLTRRSCTIRFLSTGTTSEPVYTSSYMTSMYI